MPMPVLVLSLLILFSRFDEFVGKKLKEFAIIYEVFYPCCYPILYDRLSCHENFLKFLFKLGAVCGGAIIYLFLLLNA